MQHVGTCDPSLYEQLQLCENAKNVSSAKSFDSIVSIYEAFTGGTVDRDLVDVEVTKAMPKARKFEKKKEKKGSSKGSKPSKGTKGTQKKQKRKISEQASVDSVSMDSKPAVYGICVIDFLPLFYGNISGSITNKK